MICPKGHDSSESDFCSLCGVRIDLPAQADAVKADVVQGNVVKGNVVKGNVGQMETCPDCALARAPDSGNFCEFCGYNFSTGVHGALQTAVPAPAPQIQQACEVLVEVDASLRTEESPEAPAGFAPVTIRLTTGTSLIGRRSDKRGVFPEISLDLDDAVSHRHALLNRMPDGSMVVRDVGSSNGTRLNGAELQPLTDVAVKAGDRLTLGHWTRISIVGTTPEQP